MKIPEPELAKKFLLLTKTVYKYVQGYPRGITAAKIVQDLKIVKPEVFTIRVFEAILASLEQDGKIQRQEGTDRYFPNK